MQNREVSGKLRRLITVIKILFICHGRSNLQLLEATPNEEKNNKDFDEWLKESFTNPEQLKAYKEKHYIPDVDLSFGNFESFLEAKEKLIVAALKKELM